MIFRREVEPWQQKGLCYYCGDKALTRDHIPSKVFLDEPFPDNIEQVPCCHKCNASFSKDEEYAAVLIECIKQQSTNLKDLTRKKVLKILDHSPKLLSTVKESINVNLFGELSISENDTRFSHVIMKLSKAHLRNELCICPIDDSPASVSITSLTNLCDSQVNELFAPRKNTILPEVGSKALESFMLVDGIVYSCWISYQKHTYSYYVAPDASEVMILFQDFLLVKINYQ